MSWKPVPQEEYELSRETTRDSQDELDDSTGSNNAFDSHLLTGQHVQKSTWTYAWFFLLSLIPPRLRVRRLRRRGKRRADQARRSCCRRSLFRKLAIVSYSFLAFVVLSVIVSALFFPSYTHRPLHYKALADRMQLSDRPGRGNPYQEKVFIAASIFDRKGDLLGGSWGQSILDLVDLLGPDNVFVSIYENDSGAKGMQALELFGRRLPCEHHVHYEDHINFDTLPHITLPDGSHRVKRIAYLAEVRNRALQPLDTSDIRYDKLLYLNDVLFKPEDAVHLLFSTHVDLSGVAKYRAACSMDFINPFQFYDTFASRDLEGYSMGIPFFPWFSAAGEAESRKDVMAEKDAVRVRSCWGGMVAFDARFFQSANEEDLNTAASVSPANVTAPYRFRVEDDLYWDASECCLIHADIQGTEPEDVGIYMNPFIRVAYGATSFSWLDITRRFERVYTPIQYLVDILAAMPKYNPRRAERPWEQVEESVWVANSSLPSGGSFQILPRVASHSGYCGRRRLPVIKKKFREGSRNWEFLPVPS